MPSMAASPYRPGFSDSSFRAVSVPSGARATISVKVPPRSIQNSQRMPRRDYFNSSTDFGEVHDWSSLFTDPSEASPRGAQFARAKLRGAGTLGIHHILRRAFRTSGAGACAGSCDAAAVLEEQIAISPGGRDPHEMLGEAERVLSFKSVWSRAAIGKAKM